MKRSPFSYISPPLPPLSHRRHRAESRGVCAENSANCCTAFCSAKRTIVPFGSGWRFHWGEAPDATPARPSTMGDFKRRDNMSCSGLQWDQHINMGLGGDCAVSCAYEPNCQAYELSSGWPNCYHGSARVAWSCKPCVHSTVIRCLPISWLCLTDSIACDYRGGRTTVCTRTNATALQHNYSFAAASFQDQDWKLVTIPHDYSINQTFSKDNCIFNGSNGIDGYKAYLVRKTPLSSHCFSSTY